MNTRLQSQMKAALSFTPVQSGLLQRACTCGNHTGGGECEACKKKREGTLQCVAISAPPVGEAPPIVHEVLRSLGQPLDATTRAMRQRFRAISFSVTGSDKADALQQAQDRVAADQQRWAAKAQAAQDAIDPFHGAELTCP